ncbi:MAG: calcium/sodium antiporter [Candidatus Saccharibacteria bacterium]|nr:calcium/sodium antiporter [Candidatus Saccharibacteria bacterium]
MWWQIVLLLVGFVLLIKGADIFVDGASSTAANFKVSKMLIGLTIIAFGTSAPEFAVSMQALAAGNTDMVLGNVIGSNIINILLILGLAALIKPIRVRANTICKELPICLLISVLLVVLFLDIQISGGSENIITRSDGIAIILFFLVFLYYLIALARRKKSEKKAEKPKFKLSVSLLLVLVGVAGVIIGSQLIVNSATAIATEIGVSDRIIALTVIAFGTSLPELVTTVAAARKGEADLAVGNIIGSNIFNICIVLGVPVAIFGTVTPGSFQMVDLAMLIVSAIVLFIFAKTQKKISRREGFLMLLAFAAYYAVVIIGMNA